MTTNYTSAQGDSSPYLEQTRNDSTPFSFTSDGGNFNRTLICGTTPWLSEPYCLAAKSPASGNGNDPADVYLKPSSEDEQRRWSLTEDADGNDGSLAAKYYWSIQTSDTRKYLSENGSSDYLVIRAGKQTWLLADLGVNNGTSTSPNTGTSSDGGRGEHGSGLSSGAIAGIAVGAVVGAVLLIGLITWLVLRRRKQRHTAPVEIGISHPPRLKIPQSKRPHSDGNEILSAQIYEKPINESSPAELAGDMPPHIEPGSAVEPTELPARMGVREV